MQNLKYKRYGFTIVELVIVMVVIGILSAVALPRLVNIATEARKSTTLVLGNSLKTVIELMHNQWIATSEPETINTTDNLSIFLGHDYGWPQNVGTARIDTLSSQDCIALWVSILKNPPLASDVAGCAIKGTCRYEVTAPNADTCHFQDKDNRIIRYIRTDGTIAFGTNAGTNNPITWNDSY